MAKGSWDGLAVVDAPSPWRATSKKTYLQSNALNIWVSHSCSSSCCISYSSCIVSYCFCAWLHSQNRCDSLLCYSGLYIIMIKVSLLIAPDQHHYPQDPRGQRLSALPKLDGFARPCDKPWSLEASATYLDPMARCNKLATLTKMEIDHWNPRYIVPQHQQQNSTQKIIWFFSI